MMRYLPLLLSLFLLTCTPPEPRLTDTERQALVESFDHVWTTIRDRHFDPDLNGVDWQAVHDELRPKVTGAERRSEAHRAIREMLRRLGQSHVGLIPAEDYGPAAGPGTAGLDARAVDGRAVVVSVEDGSPAAVAGVRPGWVVTRVRGERLAPVLERLGRELAANPRRELVMADAILGRLAGEVGGTLDVVFEDGDGETMSRKLTLEEPRGHELQVGNLPPVHTWIDVEDKDDGVVVVAFNQFFDVRQVMQVWNETLASHLDAPGLVVDLRGNSGGMGDMVMGMIGWLVAEKNAHVGTIYLRDLEMKLLVKPRPKTFEGKVAVLVDGLSASGSELFASALQDLERALVVGSPTCGAVLGADVERLPSGDGFLYPFSNYVSTKRGESLEGVGVTPDLVVRPTREALLAGRDEAMDAALAWIREAT